jgi:hypothetical protein
MIIFSFSLIRNVRNVHNHAALKANNERRCSKGRQLIRMLLFQVTITSFISTPNCIHGVYNAVTVTLRPYSNTNVQHLNKELIIFNLISFYYFII